MKKEIVPIKDVLKTVLSQFSDGDRYSTIDFLKTWEDVVGEDIRRHTKPIRLKQGELVVLVDSSTWLYELGFRYRDIILRGLKEKMGEKSINDIHFRTGDVKEDHGERD